MANKTDHICVCICTYKRQQLLAGLLKKLQNQKTDDIFTYSILVVDNDLEFSARSIVTDIRGKSPIPIDYYVEPEKNIALARNKAVQNASGNFVAFIDDDEFPVDEWLLNLYKTYNAYKPAGVLGHVKPYFEKEPPKWIIKGKLCERPSHKTGSVLHWTNTRTGNVLFAADIFNKHENRFNPDFGITGGEDVDFFKRMIEKDYIFIWCDEAPVYEIVPPERFKRVYFLRRALLRGRVSQNYLSFFSIFKSIIAFLIYTLALPSLLLIGHHVFMKYLTKDFDHIGKLMAVCGLDIIKEKNF